MKWSLKKKGKNVMLESAKSSQGVKMTIKLAEHSQVCQLSVVVKKHVL
jgi:hypothetical protein